LLAGRETALQYRELLQLVLHVLSRPNPAANLEIKNNFPVVSRKIAHCVTGLVSMAEILKGKEKRSSWCCIEFHFSFPFFQIV
jgi:talin